MTMYEHDRAPASEVAPDAVRNRPGAAPAFGDRAPIARYYDREVPAE